MKYIVLIASFLIFTGANIHAQQVHNFTFNDIQNTPRSFNELKGEKLTLIDFWTSRCKPCKKAVPSLNKVSEKYKNRGVRVIGINCDGPRSISKVGPLSKSLQIQYPILLDINSELMNDLNLSAFPTLILVNTKGKVIWFHEGFVTGDEEIIFDEIEKRL
ncbi:TlpA family protein disulfide reductase [Ancylomarina sp. DW003]|nr:TlpA disulfide reductase family protein [Ancylomarina sp. DW003]MDE5423221.1 TlpA family protein disulfide reductase [Ancylomarina sp. DW003]